MKRHLLTLLLALAAAMGIEAQTISSLVSDEGAWCWFADPRAIHYENASGTINATYLGYIDVHGNVKATQYDWKTGRRTDVLVRSYFQPDDHNNPTFVVLPDERVMIFYTRHTDEACIWYRISRRPGDISALGEEKRLATENNTTYPSPFILSDDPEHIYLCWRGINWHPTIARLTMPDANDNCQFDFGPKQIVQSTGARPYAKYQSNGKDKIYLCYTTGHPDNEQPNWLYFNVIDINHGNGPILRDIRGTELKRVADGVFNVNKTDSYKNSYPYTIVDNTAGIRNWVWQITLDADEHPVIAFTHIDDAKTSHVYWYGRWTGSEWRRTWVQYAGHAFHQNWNQTERCYTGGMAVDPDNVNDLYLSIPTTNGAYNKDGVYEIWRYTINADGTVGTSQQLTSGSAKNNVRPFILPGSKNSPMRLVWMNGDYYYWMVQKNYPKGYPTGIRADYEWPETAADATADAVDCVCLTTGKTLQASFAMNAASYGGTLLASDDGTFSYDLDAATQYPSITVGGTTYRSQNRLLSSDDWATQSTGTSGDNHPTKLTTWVLTLTYDGQRLTAYRNGLVDQVIDVTGLNAANIRVRGEGFNQTCLSAQTFGTVATPLSVMKLAAKAAADIQANLAETALQSIALPATTRTDLVLPPTVLGQDVTWASNNGAVLSADGIVAFPETATTVTLTATSGTATRTFDIAVQPRDIAQNLRYSMPAALDLTTNTVTGFATNSFGLAPEGLLSGLRSYTFLVKANAKSLAKSPRLYDFGSASGNSVFLRANPLSAGIKYNGGTTTMVNAATQLAVNTDYALAVTFDAATKTTRIYINGSEDASGTANQNEPYMLAELAADARNYIGRTQWWDGSYAADNQDFQGTISELSLYDVALTRKEICQLQGLAYEEVTLPADIVNGDFEGAYSVLAGSGVTSDRAIYVPEGWKVDRANPDVNDITALKTGDLQFASFFASLAKPANGGSQTYWVRQKWGTPTQTLSQTVLLPAGDYTLTADLWKSGLGGDAYITVATEGGSTLKTPTLENKTAWQEVTLDFSSDGTAATTISLVAMHNDDGSEKIIGFDNVKVTKAGTPDPGPGPTPDPDPDPTPTPITEWTFRLKNNLGYARTDETVEIAVPAGLDLAACALQTEGGQTVPFEITPDGRARFQATVGATATAGYKFVPGTATAPSKLTYAAVKSPSSRADIAWENDLNAYRMYSSTLLSSEPNTAQGVDVWYKKQAEPVIDAMYGLSNYHNESQYGVDAYSVNGKRLGCGGTAAVVGGALQMHNPYSTCSVTENASLGSAFTLTYSGISIGGSTYTKTLNVETLAGSLLNRATVRLDGPQQTIRLAVAVYEHTDMTTVIADGVDFTDVPGLIGRAENKSEGSITSAGARFYQGAYVPTLQPSGITVEPSTEVIDDHLCLVVDYTPGTELTFYFGGGWNIFPAGRYASDADWFSALEQFKQKAEAPLTATSFQTLPLKDDVLHILNSVNQTWQQRNPTHGDHFWNRAVYHIGNMEAYAATGEQQYLDFSTAWAVHNNWKGATGTNKANWKYTYGETADYVLFGDNQVCFQIYADLYNLDPAHDATKIARAREVMEYEMSTDYEAYLWWVDGLFMVMPVMTKLYNITGNQLYLDKMYTYWRWYTDRMYDTDEDLYYRDANYVYPAHKTNAGKKDFWARGDGWIFAAFAKVLQDLPATDSHRDEYISYYRRMAAALKACQQPSGYWERSLLDPDQANGYETSGTALFAYGYAWGIRAGILDEVEYGRTLELAWQYLTNVAYQTDGTVGFIQPIGSAAVPGQVLTATNYHDFGVGAYLMAAAEMSRLAAGDMEQPKLRLASAAIGEANEIVVTFNAEPNAAEARLATNYSIASYASTSSTTATLTPQAIAIDGRTATLTFADPIPYGRYTLTVSGIHSAEGGEMAADQTRTLLRTVPLSPSPTGVTVTAIGAQSGNPATNVLDNNLDTRWSQQGASGQWLQIDLGQTQDVVAVDVAVYNGTSRKNYFDIQTSTDGTTFADALTGLESSGMTNELERYALPAVTPARYVRIVCNGTSAGDWNSITEVRVRVRDTSLDDVTVPAETYGDMILPAATPDGNAIVWTSSDKDVLSGTGFATPGTDDQTVTLTATVGDESRTFDVVVRARNIGFNQQLLYTFQDEDVFTSGGSSYITDRSGNSRHGELIGAGSSVHDGLLDLTANTVAGFATNGYVLVPQGLLDGLRSYTVVVIAKPTLLEKLPRLYDFGSGSGNSVFLRAGTLAAGLKYNGGTTVLATATPQLTTDERHELAVTFDARTHTTSVYVDRQLLTTSTAITREPYELTAIAPDTRNYIGRTQWWDTSSKADNPDFTGTIDEVHVYSLALTADEIADILDNTPTAIGEMASEGAASGESAKAYDLSGRRISATGNARKGIYIIGGRKVVVR